MTYDAEGRRLISEVRLWEISVVAVPAQPSAIIGSVKNLAQVEKFMRSLQGKSADAETIAHLHAIRLHVLSLLDGVDDDDSSDDDEEEESSDEQDDPETLSFLKELAEEAQELASSSSPKIHVRAWCAR